MFFSDMSDLDDLDLRPATVLADCGTRFGWSKVATGSIGGDDRPVMTYALIAHPDKDGQWLTRWHLAGVGHEGKNREHDSILEAYTKIHGMMIEADRPELTPAPLALAVVIHGEAEVLIGDMESGKLIEHDTLPKDVLSDLVSAIGGKLGEGVGLGPVPARGVTVVTPEGMICETAFAFPGQTDPVIQVAEQWLGDPDENQPTPEGPGSEALLKAFGMLVMIRGSVGEGYDPTINGLMKYAQNLVREGIPGATAMLSFLLRLVATGIDAGKIQIGGDSDDDPGSLGSMFG